LRHAAKLLPADAFCLAMVTMTDLYPRDEWNFVFGLASAQQRVGIYSLARYMPDFDDDSSTADSPAQLTG
jgi:archaemetzincin